MKKIFVKSFKILNVLLVLAVWGLFIYLIVDKKKEKNKYSKTYNVALIKINKSINNDLADLLYDKIEEANADEKVKALLFEINSGGGKIAASFEIESMISACKKYKITYVRGTAASGAYLIATATDSIYASISSAIGSVSAKISVFDIAEKNRKEGKKFYDLTSGKYKNMFDSNIALTDEQENILKEELQYHHENFVKKVADNREMSYDEVQALADGRVYYGDKSKKLKLIDRFVQNKKDVIKALELKLEEKVEIREF